MKTMCAVMTVMEKTPSWGQASKRHGSTTAPCHEMPPVNEWIWTWRTFMNRDAILALHDQHESVCVCAPCSHRDPYGWYFWFFFCSAGGRSRCKGLRLTKLPCFWEARSDQPGVPAVENLSIAKAVSFFVVQ